MWRASQTPPIATWTTLPSNSHDPGAMGTRTNPADSGRRHMGIDGLICGELALGGCGTGRQDAGDPSPSENCLQNCAFCANPISWLGSPFGGVAWVSCSWEQGRTQHDPRTRCRPPRGSSRPHTPRRNLAPANRSKSRQPSSRKSSSSRLNTK